MAHFIKDSTFRTGVVFDEGFGYVLTCNPELEQGQPHVRVIKWERGNISDTVEDFNAHTACRIAIPEKALVFMSISGKYAIYASGKHYGNIFDDSQPKPARPRYGDIRSLKDIAGKAYAVGFGGAVYRLDDISRWSRIDDGLPEDFDIESIDGFSAADIYAGGFCGQLWQYNGQSWNKCEIPSNITINTICCASNQKVYLGGNDGIMVYGSGDCWDVLEQDDMIDDIWDIEYFADNIYLSTLSGLYRLNNDKLEAVDFGEHTPNSTYHLDSTGNILWSIGEFEVASFDDNNWATILSSA